MKKTGRKLVAFLAMFIILLATFSQPALAKEWKLKTSTDVNKPWEVKFSKPLDKSTVTAKNIFVTDGKTEHKTTLKVMSDGSTLQVSPNAPYEIGKSYTLKITTGVKSNDGKALTESVELPFLITKPDGPFRDISNKSNGVFTTITVIASGDVNKVTVNGKEMKYEGKNRHMTTLLDAKPGSTVSIIAYDDGGKRLKTERFKLENN